MLVGLSQVLGDPVAALDAAGAMLGARGRVLPMACEPLDIVAEVRGAGRGPDRGAPDPRPGRGGHHPGQVRSGGARAGRRARPARRRWPRSPQADLITFGPGSWFTSVLPHLLLPDMADAITASRGRTGWWC